MKILFIAGIVLTSLVASAREVEFSWDPMEGAIKYEIQVSDSQKFDKPMASGQVDKPTFNTQLPVGHFLYRVRVIDKKGRPGRWSQPSEVTVAPYAPDLISPKTGFEVSYFEVQPPLEFAWKAVDPKVEYEILVYKTSGQKALEEKVSGTSFKTSKLGEGEYMWKVRTVADQKYISPYCEPRRITITKKPLKPPKLILPEKDGMAAAYREVFFEWEQDPITKYTDFHFEKFSAVQGGKLFKEKIPNLTGSKYTAPYEEPGRYKWWVTTKEAKDTPGVTSDIQEFEVRNDVIAKGNYELEFSLSPVGDLYTTTSARQTAGSSMVAQQSTSSGMFVGFLGGYYPIESVGFFLSERTAQIGVENMNAYAQETDFQMRLRFGSKGFAQEFWLGYRLMDLVEAENTPAQTTTDFTTAGPLFGTRISATLLSGLKAQGSLYYFKPTTNVEGIGNLTADVYGGSLGLKWNFMYQFWLGYRFAMERINGSFITPGMGPEVNAAWTQYRLEPFFISVSFEH